MSGLRALRRAALLPIIGPIRLVGSCAKERQVEQTTLATLTDQEMADAFNRVYTDYVAPFTVNAQGLRQHVDTMEIALDHSPLWRRSAYASGAAGSAASGSLPAIGGKGSVTR